MKKSFSTVLLLLTLISCSTDSYKQKLKVKSPAISFTEKVDSIIIHKMNQYDIPGLSIGIVRNGIIIYTKGYGINDINKKEPVTNTSMFHTASISKLFTAIAVMQLVERKYFSLDTKVVKLVPEIRYSDQRVENVTIKNLLNHTSGLPDINDYSWDNDNQAENSLKNYISELDLKLESTPSSQYSYSNLGYDILGYVIEKTTGLSFEDYVETNVLEKSGMYHSDFRHFKIADSLKTSPHSKSRITGNIYTRKIYPYTREHAPSSTLNASAQELSLWMIYFFQHLKTTDGVYSYKKMIVPSFKSYPHIGLGFQLYHVEGKKAVGHYGGDTGFRSYLMMIPEDKIGLVVLANCDYEEDFRHEIVHAIAELML